MSSSSRNGLGVAMVSFNTYFQAKYDLKEAEMNDCKRKQNNHIISEKNIQFKFLST